MEEIGSQSPIYKIGAAALASPSVAETGNQKMREGFSISDVQDPYFVLNYLLSAMTSWLVYVEG